jgi:hypothetical protein
MAKVLVGSCRCGAVTFSLRSHTPHPYQLCYCSICRKTAGGGGYAINIMGDFATLKITGKRAIRVYRAKIEDDQGHCRTSKGERNFCSKCATALWLWDPRWSELVHPFASAIDTPLPAPPSKTHIFLADKPIWVKPDFGPRDRKFRQDPDLSIEDWHKKRGLWLD